MSTAGREELKSAEPSSRRKSQREEPRRSGLVHPQDTQGKGWVRSTCEALEGISLLQVCAQRGLLQGQQAGDFLKRMTSSMTGPPPLPSQDAAPRSAQKPHIHSNPRKMPFQEAKEAQVLLESVYPETAQIPSTDCHSHPVTAKSGTN